MKLLAIVVLSVGGILAVLVGMPLLAVVLLFGQGAEDDDCEYPGLLGEPSATAQPADPTAQDDPVTTGDSFDTLTNEQMTNAQLIVELGVDSGVPEFGQVVAIAAAMQESRLLNLEGGDRDSLGLFQQRPSSGWGSPEQILDPAFATRAFYGGSSSPHWRAPSNRSEPPGLRDIVGYESMTVAQAAQAVQRSAFPDAYAQWEQLARQVVATIGTGDVGGGGGEPCGPGDAMKCPATSLPAEAGLTPDALRVLRCLHEHFPEIPSYIGVAARADNPNSDHPDGRAVDALMPPGGTVINPRALGDRAAQWLVDHVAELGVKYVIWYEQIWSVDRSEEGWRPYEHPSGDQDDTSLHRDHIHVSVYGNAAGGDPGEWVVPVQGDYSITATFGACGSRWSNCHTGVDLASPAVRPIVAAAAGEVTTIADLDTESYGKYVVITHPDGTESWYGHLADFAPPLTLRQQVSAGQLIGYMGATGNATGPHLHFEIRPGGGAPIDPQPWMADRGVTL